MKRIIAGLFLALLAFASPALAQSTRIQAQAVATCGALSLSAGVFYPVNQDLTGTLCISGGGGGGGLSVQDAATWTAGTSNFTPTGGVFNDSATALVSGHQGTVRLNANREMHVTCDATNAMCALLSAAVPWLSTTAWSTNTYSNGTTNPGAADLHGAPFVDIGAVAGVAVAKGGVQVVNGGSTYNHVAASQTAQALTGGGGGATGDYLSHCVIYPSTTAAGSVTVFDNTNSAANNVIEFTTGTLSNLAPIAIPVGAVSVNGPWKVTTGANETVACFGKFTANYNLMDLMRRVG